MGQAITVTRKAGTRPDIVRYELNRSLTGMGTERYSADHPVMGTRPPDELARRLLALGTTAVTVYSNVVTVNAPADKLASLRSDIEDTIANLFIYYRDGQAPALATEPAPATEPAAVEGAEEPTTS